MLEILLVVVVCLDVILVGLLDRLGCYWCVDVIDFYGNVGSGCVLLDSFEIVCFDRRWGSGVWYCVVLLF